MVKKTVSVILSDRPCTKPSARFEMVPLKPLTVHRVKRYLCLNK